MNPWQEYRERRPMQSAPELLALPVGAGIGQTMLAAPVMRELFADQPGLMTVPEHGSLAELSHLAGLKETPKFQRLKALLGENVMYRPDQHSITLLHNGGSFGPDGRLRPMSMPVLAHEIGHAMGFKGPAPLWQRLAHAAYGPGKWAAILSAIVGSVAVVRPKASLRSREADLNAASVLAGLGGVPVLASEHAASSNAMKLLQKMRTSDFVDGRWVSRPRYSAAELNRAAGILRRALTHTYAPGVAAGVALPQLAKLYLRRRDR